jgi:hypothetical protein
MVWVDHVAIRFGHLQEQRASKQASGRKVSLALDGG